MPPLRLPLSRILLGFIISALLLLPFHRPISLKLSALPQTILSFPKSHRLSCTPQAYSSGSWVYNPRTDRKKMENQSDAFEFSGFEGCASTREIFWHLAADNEEQWDRFPNAHSWRWSPSRKCHIPSFDKEAMVRDLVEEGGWLLLGDSITEGHFFSISCLLYPHVRAAPNYIENPYFDRAWPQHLFLNPDSPLVKTLRTPSSFNISSTPLVTFRRSDLLISKEELIALHKTKYSQSLNPSLVANKTLFSEEQTWSISIQETMDLFRSTEEGRNYQTLIISTGGHWTTTLFSWFRDELKKDSGYGIDGVIAFFREAVNKWADSVQAALDADRRMQMRRPKRRRVVVRAYLPGHEDCHKHRKPWTSVQPFVWNWYNWGNIWEFNKVFEDFLSSSKYPDIHFLPIDRPARLRPDAHTTGDCLHIMTGSNVMEGWTHYIWHYIKNEL